MAIDRNDVEDIGILIFLMMWLFAVADVASGGTNQLVFLFMVISTIVFAVGLIKTIADVFNKHYKKRDI